MSYLSNKPTAADRFSTYAYPIFVLGVYVYATPLIALCCIVGFVPVLVLSLIIRENFLDLFVGVLEWTLHPPEAERPVYGLMAAGWMLVALIAVLCFIRT